MKRLIYAIMLALVVLGYSCTDDDVYNAEPIYVVKARVIYPEKEKPTEGLEVVFVNENDKREVATVKTDANGIVSVELKQGVYNVNVSEERKQGIETFLYAINKEVTINAGWNSSTLINLNITKTDISKKYHTQVQLRYPDGYNSAKDVKVTLIRKVSEHKYEDVTDESGKVAFELIKGKYTVSVSEERTINNKKFIFEGTTEIEVTENWNTDTPVTLNLERADLIERTIKVKLVDSTGQYPHDSVNVYLYKDNVCIDTILTNNEGIALINKTQGTYTFSIQYYTFADDKTIVFEGQKTIPVISGWDETTITKIDLTKTEITLKQQLITKELFMGGTPKDDGSGAFAYDRYIILYNNTEFPARITQNFALATTLPYNSSGSNKYIQGGHLIYENKTWMPAGQGLWHFKRDVEIAPYSQIVIATANAVDNTVTYSKSINFANSEYFCTYDTKVWDHAATYVSPSEEIPTKNFLKGITYGKGTAWSLSNPCPGFFMFSTKDISLTDFVADANTTDNTYSYASTKKVPREWIIDGVEAFKYGKNNNKRFTNDVDAGYINYTTKMGYSIYRNVDKQATEAIEGNSDKLVYSYALGTETIDGGSTDPSGIDAEASMKNGAKIIYKDTNNSTDDFHQRAKASLRNN